VELKEVAGKWRFQTASDLSFLFHQQRQEPKRLSKAALETLAIVAYCQPVTRAEIEDVRGVSASKGTFDVLLDAGFIRLRGRRRSPGRPVTYGTTDAFLEHFGLASLDHLPGKAEFVDCQLLSQQALEGFSIPRALGALAGEDSLDASGDDGTAEFTLDFLEGAVD
jgi:segregation and condensation protein B